ncbi:IS110 family transposase [Solwaraspora sp. WMMB762]|uniref:IS110 family transposase n=1 Tax=Solwaraspora sp. WMMB762 TaxID=3404120 RepID=UPI003B9404DE
MTVIGIDAHKRTHTLVAVDDLGRKLGERTIAATDEGHFQALEWSARWTQVTFAVEDCRHMTRRLERDLLRAGQRVVRVHTRLMAAARRSGRQRGKSDPIDAEAVALAALREPDLPNRLPRRAHPAGETVVRPPPRPRRGTHQTVRSAPRHLHELDSELQVPSRGLRRYRVIDELTVALAEVDGTVARIARDLLTRCRELTEQINALERELRGGWSRRWRRRYWASPGWACSARR